MGVLRRLLLLASVLGALTACEGAGDPAGDGPGQVGSASGTDADSPPEGTLSGDPTAIRAFPEPAVEVVDSADLTAYLLPGLTGTGADCVEERVDLETALGADVEVGAASVSELVLSCVEQSEIAEILAMYAVGFEPDGPSRYADLARCVAEDYVELPAEEVRESLSRVYGERLELTGPPTSRAVAAEEIVRLTDCTD